MKTIKILIVDDHPIVRNGIKLVLKKCSEFEVVAEASTGLEAIKYLDHYSDNIDVIIMDIVMPVMTGVKATEIITNKFKSVKVLAVTMHREKKYMINMIKAGAMGYILKDSATEELIEALKTVAKGKKYYSNEVSITLINSLMNKDNSKEKELSEREIEILKCVAKGDTNKEIGEKFSLSRRTIETHRRNIMSKLGVRNTAELINYVIKSNLFD